MPDNHAAIYKIKLLQRIFTSFGLAVNLCKSDMVLRSSREHLGLTIDLHNRAFRVSSGKLSKLKTFAG